MAFACVVERTSASLLLRRPEEVSFRCKKYRLGTCMPLYMYMYLHMCDVLSNQDFLFMGISLYSLSASTCSWCDLRRLQMKTMAMMHAAITMNPATALPTIVPTGGSSENHNQNIKTMCKCTVHGRVCKPHRTRVMLVHLELLLTLGKCLVSGCIPRLRHTSCTQL